MKAKLNDFQDLTGIKVNLTTMPESNYYEKLNVELASKSGSIDVFMTGAYQAWEYATAGYMEPLEGYIENSSLTSADYDYDDFIDGVIDALKWDCVPGHAVGTGSQWALPMGWEINILTYNKQILADHNITPPKTAEELLAAATALKEFDGSGTYGLALRGTADWGTIHPAYMSMYHHLGRQGLRDRGRQAGVQGQLPRGHCYDRVLGQPGQERLRSPVGHLWLGDGRC